MDHHRNCRNRHIELLIALEMALLSFENHSPFSNPIIPASPSLLIEMSETERNRDAPYLTGSTPVEMCTNLKSALKGNLTGV